MGFIDNKTETVNNVALFNVLNGLPKTKSTSSLASVRSKSKNMVPFLIDLMAMTCKDNSKKPNATEENEKNPNPKREVARCEATRLLLQILAEFFPALIKILKEGIVKAIKAGLACNMDFTIPNPSISGANIKVKMPVKNLDMNGQLKINPNTPVGSTFYGKNPSKDFNFQLHDTIQNGGQTSWKNIIDVNYTKTSQDVEFGLNPNYIANGGLNGTGSGGSGLSFDKFLTETVDSFEMMSLEQFQAKMTNKLTGSLTANLPEMKKSLDQLIAEEKLDKLMDKINESDPCKEEYNLDDSYFSFNNDELLEIENRANQKARGAVDSDVGCGVVPISIEPNVMVQVFNDIRNATPTSTKVVLENSLKSINDSLTRGLDAKDKKAASLALNAKMVELIPKIMTETIMEPKMVVLYQLASRMVNGPLTPGTPPVGTVTPPSVDVSAPVKASNSFDYAKATKVFFEFVARESLAALLEIIFRQVKNEIIKLVTEAALKIIKEKIKYKIKALEFITGAAISGVLSSVPTPDISKYT